MVIRNVGVILKVQLMEFTVKMRGYEEIEHIDVNK